MTSRGRAGWLIGMMMLAACGQDRVEPLPPLQRPSAEKRAGLPEVGGRWLFAGWEIPAEDTARVTTQEYRLVPPGEIRVITQRMDSIAGQYGVPGQYVLPLVGEVRRDGVLSAVVNGGDAGQSFLSARVLHDTLWMELSSLPQAAGWPPRTRAAFARRPRGAPFTRLLGGAPIVRGPDSATLAAMRIDSLRRDSLARAAQMPTPVQVQPQPQQPPFGAAPTPTQPRTQPPAVSGQRPTDNPAGERPRPPRRARIDSTRGRPPLEPARRDTEPPPAPEPPPGAPRETIRIGSPPRG